MWMVCTTEQDEAEWFTMNTNIDAMIQQWYYLQSYNSKVYMFPDFPSKNKLA